MQTNSNLILDKIIRKTLLDCLFLLVFYLAKKLDCIWEWDENKIKKIESRWRKGSEKESFFKISLNIEAKTW